MKYKYAILLVIFVIGIIVSGFLYVAFSQYLEGKGYDYQSVKGISGSICFIIGLPIAISVNIYYKLKYKKK